MAESAAATAATASRRRECDDPPALTQFRREAGEASAVITLEDNRQLQCTVRSLPTAEDQHDGKNGDDDQEDASTTTTVTTVTTAATTAPETIATVPGIEVLFVFRQAVFCSHERRKLFMHWGVGSRPDVWEAFPPDFAAHFSSSAPTNFKSSNAAETEFPSPSSRPPPVVRFLFRAPHIPAYLSFLFFATNEDVPHEGLLWIRQQHPRGNATLSLHQLLQQTLQQRCFLQQVTQTRKQAIADLLPTARNQEQPQQQRQADGDSKNERIILPPLVTAETCTHWSVPVGDLRMQIMAFTYVDAVAAAVEIYTDFSAALTLYWGESDGPSAAWQTPEAEALLGQPGAASADGGGEGAAAAIGAIDFSALTTEEQEEQEEGASAAAGGGDSKKNTETATSQDKPKTRTTTAADDRKRWRKEALQLQRMTRQFGGFATYMQPGGKACYTQFEFLSPTGGSIQRVSLCLAGNSVTRSGLAFVLREVKADRWLKNEGGTNFFVPLPTHKYWQVLRAEKEKRQQLLQQRQQQLAQQRAQQYNQALKLFQQQKKQREEKGTLSYYAVTLSEDAGYMDVYTYPDSEINTTAVYVQFTVCARVPLVLHWGVLDIMGSAQQSHSETKREQTNDDDKDQQKKKTLQGREERWEAWKKEGYTQADLEKRREEDLQQLMARRGAPAQWVIPPPEMRPPGTVVVDPIRAVQTPFFKPAGRKEPKDQQMEGSLLQELLIVVPARRCPRASEEDPGIDTRYDGIACCLKEAGGAHWYRSSDGRDIQVRLLLYGSSSYKGLLNAEMVSRIVEAEVEWQHMTLMHRYQLARGFLDDFERQHDSSLLRAARQLKQKQQQQQEQERQQQQKQQKQKQKQQQGQEQGEEDEEEEGGFALRVKLERELAVDWPRCHYEPPPLLLPLEGFSCSHTQQQQQTHESYYSSYDSSAANTNADTRSTRTDTALTSSYYSAYIEDYKELAIDTYKKEEDFWQWIFVWCRYAFLGLLDWQRNYNTKPKDLAWASEQLTYATAKAWRAFPPYRNLIRSCLGLMGRGGAQGQAIRDRILEIMHKHRIPETAGQFYEQWHQKLHNNTTPDDIGICEAVIAYLKGHGNLGAYWSVLREHGISRERLASYERKITCEPYVVHTNVGELISDFEKYLAILKDVHDALDIQQAFGYARNYLPDDAARVLDEAVRRLGALPAAQRERQQQLLLQQQRGTAALQAQGQQEEGQNEYMSSLQAQHNAAEAEAALRCFQLLQEGRLKILFFLYGHNGALTSNTVIDTGEGAGGEGGRGGAGGGDGYIGDSSPNTIAMTRQLLFLDLSLEQQQNVLIQGCCAALSLQQLVTAIRDILLTLSANAPTCMELRSMYSDITHIGDALAEVLKTNAPPACGSIAETLVADSREAALLLKALADRVGRYIGTVSDAAQQQLGSKAVFLGQQVGTDKRVRDVFVDEVLRGSSLFPLSLLLKRIEPLLRAAARLPPWQLVSVVPKAQGELMSISSLRSYQERVFETPTVLLCGAVSGEEEIPIGVQAVLVRSADVSPDILSHVSVRARNANILLAVCFDATVAQRLEELKGEWVTVETARDGSNITVERSTRPPVQLTRRASKLFNRQRSQLLFEDATLQLQRSLSRSMSGNSMSSGPTSSFPSSSSSSSSRNSSSNSSAGSSSSSTSSSSSSSGSGSSSTNTSSARYNSSHVDVEKDRGGHQQIREREEATTTPTPTPTPTTPPPPARATPPTTTVPPAAAHGNSTTSSNSNKSSNSTRNNSTTTTTTTTSSTSTTNHGAVVTEDVMDLTRQSDVWCVSSAAFSRDIVGGKSFNLKYVSEALRRGSACGVLTPRSIALPYGCMQKVLGDGSNRKSLAQLQQVLQQLSPLTTTGKEAEAIFHQARQIVTALHIPQELIAAIEVCAAEEDCRVADINKKKPYGEKRSDKTSDDGTPDSSSSSSSSLVQTKTEEGKEREEDIGGRPSLVDLWKQCGDAKCMHAIKYVWASLFALRPWISLAKAHLNFTALNMAVLVQELLPAHCAFVLHSRNPFASAEDKEQEMYGELALGLGEVIVGNYGGRSLGWRMRRGGEPIVVAFPSKSNCLFCPPSLVFRSDSNGEDLENFAGAGLFETTSAQRTRMQCVTYWNQRIIKDKFYRQHLLKKIGNLAFEVEKQFGEPQDIEGVVIGYETLAIVQSRHQV